MVRIHGITVVNKEFPCNHCEKILTTKRSLVYHTKEKHGIEL